MVIKTPTKYFLVSGASEGYTLLNAFDQALLNAGIGDTNLVRLSSILPPDCQQIEKITIPGGSLVPVAYASLTSKIPGDVISSAVAIGIPKDSKQVGLIMEYSATLEEREVTEKVIQMVEQGMKFRNREIKEIKYISATYNVVKYGATFAAVILWD